MSRLQAKEMLPGVFHIRDVMGVFMTLIVGEDRALLIDAGYGFEDVQTFVRTITDKPVTLLLTHAHHDHALGAMWFDRALMFAQDMEAFAQYTGRSQRMRCAEQAKNNGVSVAPGYLDAPIAPPIPLCEQEMDLGGVTVQVIHCPGHTPGSTVLYLPKQKLLLTGDDWNPCTWLFFPEALGAKEYRANVQALLALPFDHVLCPHREALYPRAEFESFVRGLTDEALRAARRVDMGWNLDTREAVPAKDQVFVFDWDKAALGSGEEQA